MNNFSRSTPTTNHSSFTLQRDKYLRVSVPAGQALVLDRTAVSIDNLVCRGISPLSDIVFPGPETYLFSVRDTTTVPASAFTLVPLPALGAAPADQPPAGAAAPWPEPLRVVDAQYPENYIAQAVSDAVSCGGQARVLVAGTDLIDAEQICRQAYNAIRTERKLNVCFIDLDPGYAGFLPTGAVGAVRLPKLAGDGRPGLSPVPPYMPIDQGNCRLAYHMPTSAPHAAAEPRLASAMARRIDQIIDAVDTLRPDVVFCVVPPALTCPGVISGVVDVAASTTAASNVLHHLIGKFRPIVTFAFSPGMVARIAGVPGVSLPVQVLRPAGEAPCYSIYAKARYCTDAFMFGEVVCETPTPPHILTHALPTAGRFEVLNLTNTGRTTAHAYVAGILAKPATEVAHNLAEASSRPCFHCRSADIPFEAERVRPEWRVAAVVGQRLREGRMLNDIMIEGLMAPVRTWVYAKVERNTVQIGRRAAWLDQHPSPLFDEDGVLVLAMADDWI